MLSQINIGLALQAGEAPTEDVERDWQRMERERTQLLDMKQQVQLSHVLNFVQVIIEGFERCFGQSLQQGPFYVYRNCIMFLADDI